MKYKCSFAFMLLSIVALVVVLIYPVSAHEPFIPDAGSVLIDSDFISPYVAVNSYTVYAYISGNGSSNTSTATLNENYASIYTGPSNYGGYRITIPANNSAGTLYVYGFFPALYSISTGSSWNTSISASDVSISPAWYYLATSSAGLPSPPQSGRNLDAPVFDGSVYIPAHSSTLYLYVYNDYDANTATSPTSLHRGAVRLSGAFITFVPDSSSVNYSSQLSSLVSNTSASSSALNDMLSRVTSIDNQLAAFSSSLGPSAMEQFEDRYIESMQDQLDGVESMMSPDNSALPNDGDFVGFVSDVQDGLGVSGSSFNPSEFAEATSKFGDTNATGPGGPWEFFSQSVQDSLAGDTSAIGLDDDDYIYAWLDEAQRRYGLWNSSSP